MKISCRSFALLLAIWSFLLSATGQSGTFRVEGLEHVFVIGVDGLSPDGIRGSLTPAIDELARGGAATMRARAVLPSSSAPNWASMIMGAGPEQHGITSNEWRKDKYVLPPSAVDETGYFPTIFSILRSQEPQAEIGAIYHWEGFGHLFSHAQVDFHTSPKTEEATAAETIRYIREEKPRFCFIHFDHVDGAGHSHGHGSPGYYRAVEKADSLIGAILTALREERLLDRSLVLLTADHGGVGTKHGGETPAEMEIPFILYGKGIKKGYEIAGPVNTYDNAATVAFALGLERPAAWVGRPVEEAFEGKAAPRLRYGPRLASPQATVEPLPNAHAHNDYEHARPLLDALEQGFTSVEADVYLIDGELYVSHDRPQSPAADRTLKTLYLEPLRARAAANGGRIYPGYSAPFFLMIDIKTEAESTYAALKKALDPYRDLFATYEGDQRLTDAPCIVFLSGNRPLETVRSEKRNFIALDGRPEDIGRGFPAPMMPVISERYGKILNWRGEGEIPSKEWEKLQQLAEAAEKEGKKLRLWASPDDPKVWETLIKAGADLINTDDLQGLRAFLLQK